jgi:hypothetical protein
VSRAPLNKTLGGVVVRSHMFWMLALACFCIGSSHGVAQEVTTGPGFIANQQDRGYGIGFRPPPQHVEAADVATKAGLVRAYKLPAPDGNSRSFFTVAFQRKAEKAGLRDLTEFAETNVGNFRTTFQSGVVARVNIQGRIPAKFAPLGFPLQMFMFKGNERPGSSNGDSLVLFFATPDGFWSVVWTIPQQFIEQGLPVFFEPFVDGMTVETRSVTK